MQSWIIPLALLFVAVLAFAVFRLRRAMRRQRDAVRAIRESRLYAHVYPCLLYTSISRRISASSSRFCGVSCC